jgi:hypothetical protein
VTDQPEGGGWANPTWGEPAAPPPGAGPGGTAPPGTPPPGDAPPGYAPPGYPPPAYGPYGRLPDPAPRPGAVPLRPLGVGEVLDGALTIIRRHPRITIGLAALVVTVQQGISVIAQVSSGSIGGVSFPLARIGTTTGPLVSNVGVAISVLNLLISTVLGAILTGMLMIVVSESVLGRSVDLGQVWSRVRPRFWALLGGSVLAGLLPAAGILVGLVVGLVVGLLFNGIAGAVAGIVLGVILLIFPGVYLWGMLALTTPAIVLERLGPLQGLRRSWQLVRPDFWRVWGIRALAALIGSFLSGIIATPFATVGTIVLLAGGLNGDPAGWRQLVFLVASAIGGIVAGSVVLPYQSGVIGLLYVDRRMRGEGLDIALQETARASRLPQAAPGGAASGWA